MTNEEIEAVRVALLDLDPLFSSADSDRVGRLVTAMDLTIGGWATGETRTLALAFLVAHLLTVAANGGRGNVIAERSPELSVEYDAGELNGSAWGGAYRALARRFTMGPLTRMGVTGTVPPLGWYVP